MIPLDESGCVPGAGRALHDVLVCSDECYVDLYDGEAPHSLLETGGTEGVH